MGGTYFRDAHYGALFTVVGLSLAVILLVMIYRDRVELVLRRMSGALHKEPRDKTPPSD
jgi:hypothetical protein